MFLSFPEIYDSNMKALQHITQILYAIIWTEILEILWFGEIDQTLDHKNLHIYFSQIFLCEQSWKYFVK